MNRKEYLISLGFKEIDLKNVVFTNTKRGEFVENRIFNDSKEYRIFTNDKIVTAITTWYITKQEKEELSKIFNKDFIRIGDNGSGIDYGKYLEALRKDR